MKKSILLSIAAFVALSFAVSIIAQETESPSPTIPVIEEERLVVETKDKENPVTKNLKPSREFRRRLPNGFAAVVDNNQREEIYKIQKDYYDVIELLRVRIELLENERNTKIDALLTPDQKERVKRSLVRRPSQR